MNAFTKTFCIPEDYQEKAPEAHRKMEATCTDSSEGKPKLTSRLVRVKDLYKWEHIGRKEYLREREAIQRQLEAFTSTESHVSTLDELAKLLAQ